MSSTCGHVCIVGDYTQEDIAKKQEQNKCESCDATGPNLWACLHYDCLYVGCGDGQADHSTKHFQKNNMHSLTLNLLTLRVWCYLCQREVFLENNDPPAPGILSQAVHISSNLVTAAEPDVNDDDDNDDPQNFKPRGLTGLQNLGNTCYMNAALQSLSNCPQLTQFFLDCGCYVRSDVKPGLAKSYMKLISEIWHKQRPSYVVPSGISHGIKLVFPVFRGYTQQDAQEFLRCFMDQLHEELKETVPECDSDSDSGCPMETNSSQTSGNETDNLLRNSDRFNNRNEKNELAEVSPEDSSQSEAEFETCDSGLSSEKSSYSGEFVDQEPMDETEFISSTGKENENTLQTGRRGLDDSDEGIKLANGTSSTASLETTVENNVDRNAGGPKSADRTNAPYRFSNTLSPVAVGNKSHHVPNKCGRSTMKGQQGKRKNLAIFHSIISDIFDGKILSSVQCLTCDTVSTTRETFQDLSLPIPSRDHLNLLHSTHGGLINLQKVNSASQSSLVAAGGSCSEGYNHQTWFQWMFGWMFNWFWGPTISLQDCLSAFFSADELKGDNMYSCDKCKKLRNGIKYSKVLQLPEVLCIHLKRFRHEVMFSSKIGSYVTFPLEGLDMSMFLHKDCPRGVTTYDLIAVICHHGTAGSGHYTSYCLNHLNEQWYEFDDQYVTAVDPQMVQNCEAYVLFYRKSCDEIIKKRQLAVELMERSKSEPGLLQFFISKQWVNRFNTFAEPGPITNTDFLCSHGGVHPNKANYVEDLCTMLSQAVWEYLHDTFGGGPPCNHLFICPTCQGEQEALERRQKMEHDTFVMLNKEYQAQDSPQAVYALSLYWFKQWEAFVKGKTSEPPGTIDNSMIGYAKNGVNVLRSGSDYGSISDSMWKFLLNIYGGGPEIVLQKSIQHMQNSSGSSSQSIPAAAVQQSALASLHTTGRASTATNLSGGAGVKREKETQVGHDSPCGSIASSYKGSSASSLNPFASE